jgi:hypothetical protein
MDIERRELFRIIGVAAASAGSIRAEPYRPRFFSENEYDLLTRLCAAILPADEDGGGAEEAGVPRYIDTLVFHSDGPMKEFWRHGLTAVSQMKESPADDAVRVMAGAERAPSSDAERFFVRLKAVTIEAFFQSAVGMKYVGYEGNTGVMTFPGCTHEHSEA